MDKPINGNFNNSFASKLDIKNFNEIFKNTSRSIGRSSKSPFVENGKIKIFNDPAEITPDVLTLLSNSQLFCSWKNSMAIYKEEKQILNDQIELRDKLIRKQNEIYNGLQEQHNKYVSDVQIDNDLFKSTANRDGDSVDIKASRLLETTIVEQDGLKSNLMKLQSILCNLASTKTLLPTRVTNPIIPQQPPSL